MKQSTLAALRCAATQKCGGDLALAESSPHEEILFSNLVCKKCKTAFPILAGVAIVVPDVEAYLVHHVKGISKFVTVAQIPKAYRESFREAKSEIPEEYVEEDLESDRVNALYLMNHYLSVSDAKTEWWKSGSSPGDPLLSDLVKKYWDQGPFSLIQKWFSEMPKSAEKVSVVDLGCGVGGLCRKIEKFTESYLGVDSSFQSILLARHFNLGTPYTQTIQIPEDLYHGPVSRALDALKPKVSQNAKVDFVVGVIDLLPLQNNRYDVSVTMNTLDMLDDPRVLPEVQHKLLKHAGIAIQCGPYIWHEQVAKRLRNQLPKSVQNSADAVEAIYKKAGFKITESVDYLPWLFFKHVRQLELYSVHAIRATKV